MRSKTAATYQSERERITGRGVWLSPFLVRKFNKLDHILQSMEIDPVHYIENSIAMWQKFSEAKGMEFPSVDLICGIKAIENYKKNKSATGDEYIRAVLLSTEHDTAELTIMTRLELDPPFQLKELVEELHNEFEMLSEVKFSEYCKKHPDVIEDVRLEVITLVSKNHGVTGTFEDYEELAMAVVERKRG